MAYETVIGLEVHVELKTAAKVFCGCDARFGAEANTRTCPGCLGFPGSLPVLNKQAVNFTIMAGLALHCRIAPFSRFHRKQYFYPDLPGAYQISQYDLPLCEKGRLEIVTPEGNRTIGINRIYLEEEDGRTLLSGAGRKGNPWLVISATGLGCTIFVPEQDLLF